LVLHIQLKCSISIIFESLLQSKNVKSKAGSLSITDSMDGLFHPYIL
jgi:hypothetical protein